jgi:hypothetical protein
MKSADGLFAEMCVMFQIAIPASNTPALSPTLGSGLGEAIFEISTGCGNGAAGVAMVIDALAPIDVDVVELDELMAHAQSSAADTREKTWRRRIDFISCSINGTKFMITSRALRGNSCRVGCQ